MAIHLIPIVLIGARPSLVPKRQPQPNAPVMLPTTKACAANVVVLHLPLRSAVSEIPVATATAPLPPPAVPQPNTAATERAPNVVPIAIAATATRAAAVTPVSAELE